LSDTLRFDGRTVVITGGGRGIGRAYAELLASRGASVVVNDLGTSLSGAQEGSSPAAEVVEVVTQQGGKAVADASDISTEQGAQNLIDTAIEQFGRIDVLIHNAGIVNRAPFAEVSASDFNRHVAVHQAGAFYLTRAAWGHFVSQHYGRVVITVSTALFGLPEVIPYSSAKGGAFGLARGLALEGARDNIRVNMVAPSAMTRMAAGDSNVWSPEQNRMIPKREAGMDSDKVAPLVAVLAHESCPVSGETYYSAGGRVSRLFVGQTSGWTFDRITPEDVLDKWAAINDRDQYSVPLILPDALKVSWVDNELDPNC
jgi:NAD(P)-dependent dehydrogenase (short-subunit alcohol dehydrogenase family)